MKTINIGGVEWKVVKSGVKVEVDCVRSEWIQNGYCPDSAYFLERDSKILPFPIERMARLHVESGNYYLVPR